MASSLAGGRSRVHVPWGICYGGHESVATVGEMDLIQGTCPELDTLDDAIAQQASKQELPEVAADEARRELDEAGDSHVIREHWQ